MILQEISCRNMAIPINGDQQTGRQRNYYAKTLKMAIAMFALTIMIESLPHSFFIHGNDIEPTYTEIEDGSWIDDTPYGVIHRLASDGSQKGTGSFCINWAYEQCKHIRIDTHIDNTIMQKLVEKLGFIHCGTIYVKQDDYPRLAYEKTTNI